MVLLSVSVPSISISDAAARPDAFKQTQFYSATFASTIPWKRAHYAVEPDEVGVVVPLHLDSS
jgi:hypothetical protein